MPEVKVLIKSIENLKTSTGIKEEMEKGEVVDRKLVTKVQFESAIAPADLAEVHRLLASGALVFVVMGSSQSVMEMMEEPVLSAK